MVIIGDQKLELLSSNWRGYREGLLKQLAHVKLQEINPRVTPGQLERTYLLNLAPAHGWQYISICLSLNHSPTCINQSSIQVLSDGKLCQLYNGGQGRRCGLKHTNEIIWIHEAVSRVCEVRKGPPIICRKHDLTSSLVLASAYGLWMPRHVSPRHIYG